MKRHLPFFILLLLTLLSACKKEDKDTTDYDARDEALITSYIQANNLTGFQRQDTSGVYYAITQPGTGPKATAGKTLIVKYKGTTLDGAQFDQSNPAAIGFSFVLGVGNVIGGWDKAFTRFNKGAKGILLIPSKQGYGGAANGAIPANSVLRFDVEVVDIR